MLYVCRELSTLYASQRSTELVHKVLGLFGVPEALQDFRN